MKIIFALLVFLLLIFVIPFLSAVLILTSPFILIYKIKVLNKPKPKELKKNINPIDFIFSHKATNFFNTSKK